MKKALFVIFVLLLAISFLSCKIGDDSSSDSKNDSETTLKNNQEDIKLLPAPENFRTTIMMNTTSGYSFSFKFNAVEKAVNYMIYYGTNGDKSTAKPFLSTTEMTVPYLWDQPRSVTYTFWIRAYDGKNYGEWSNSISLRF